MTIIINVVFVVVVVVVTEDGGDGVAILSSYGNDYEDTILCQQ